MKIWRYIDASLLLLGMGIDWLLSNREPSVKAKSQLSLLHYLDEEEIQNNLKTDSAILNREKWTAQCNEDIGRELDNRE